MPTTFHMKGRTYTERQMKELRAETKVEVETKEEKDDQLEKASEEVLEKVRTEYEKVLGKAPYNTIKNDAVKMQHYIDQAKS